MCRRGREGACVEGKGAGMCVGEGEGRWKGRACGGKRLFSSLFSVSNSLSDHFYNHKNNFLSYFINVS